MYIQNIIVMKVGPHTGMGLSEIIQSKKEEEIIHGVHYWGYSGVFCQPGPTQQFCDKCVNESAVAPKLVLIETKSSYKGRMVKEKRLYLVAPFNSKIMLPAVYYLLTSMKRQFSEKGFDIDIDICIIKGFQYTSTYSLGVGSAILYELNEEELYGENKDM